MFGILQFSVAIVAENQLPIRWVGERRTAGCEHHSGTVVTAAGVLSQLPVSPMPATQDSVVAIKVLLIRLGCDIVFNRCSLPGLDNDFDSRDAAKPYVFKHLPSRGGGRGT